MLTPDTVLQGRYKIVRQLGQGGMGTVYEALDERLDTTVALKETVFTDERLRKQFEREARLLARLHHPALPRVSDHFSEGEGQFLVMQFIPGEDLSEMMVRKNGPFPPDQVLTWADQLLDALDYLHTQEPQIVHRDIKPQNLKLTSRGQIILLDFGLAKGQAGDISRVTTSASIFGYTPNYAPLEQIQGLGTDSRSDLYSLAATVYHLLTARKPPDALTRAAALVNSQADPLVPATELNPAVATEVSSVLHQAMSQGKEQRFASAAEMRKALHRTDQTATVINRSEAQTILRPPAVSTVSAPATQMNAEQATAVAGETTVVRPLTSSSGRRGLPWILSGAALFIVAACVLGFYVTRKPDDAVVHLSEPTPSPAATSEPAASPVLTPAPTASAEAKPSVGSKTSKRTEPPKKETTSRTTSPQPVPNNPPPSGEHEAEAPEPPEVPRDNVTGPPRIRVNPRGVPQITLGPGGVVIRSFPDGSKLISSPDGSRVYISPDGRRQVLGPGQKNTKRRPTSP
jgi:eukaryotic-like serine/threonine-protein kinase